MNLLISLTDKWANLPIWAWIVIAAVVLILIIVIAVVAAKAHRAKKEQTEEEELSAPAEEVHPVAEPVQDEEAAPVTVKEEPAPAEKTVREEPAKPAPAPAPAQKAPAQQKPVQQKAEQAKPAPAAKPVQKAEKPSEQPEEQPAAQSAYVPQAAAQTKVYHITKRKSDGKWQVKFNNGKKAIKLFDTQNQAIDYAKALAQNQEAGIMIHKEDGTFRKLRYDKPNKQ